MSEINKFLNKKICNLSTVFFVLFIAQWLILIVSIAIFTGAT